nr:hypothetical protein [Stenotrophomonas maltophilia]
MMRPLRIAWTAVCLATVIAVPLRIAEIVAAHNPGAFICVATSTDAFTPTFAFSHTNLNQGNLKDE